MDAPDYKVQLDAAEWVTPAPGIRFKLYSNNEVQVRLIEFSKGLEHPEWCCVGHTAYVLEGKLELRFQSGTQSYEPGSVLVIPEGEAHKHIPRALSKKVTLFSVEKPQPQHSDQ